VHEVKVPTRRFFLPQKFSGKIPSFTHHGAGYVNTKQRAP